jgi:hypothetical protein
MRAPATRQLTADAERLAVLTGYLRAELLRLDVEDVTALPAGEPPPGARVFGAAAVGALLVAVGQSVEGLRSVVSVIMDWLRRGEGTGVADRSRTALQANTGADLGFCVAGPGFEPG